eukprot:TRINITY_DN65256_c0_g1_i1.p1 TRINITY_DN65256_c0_g1~~TRINITY_DN65256_c0_g1_i1.p1  ORF type:complete len:224 (-),score=87.26 TRINITY_DN65256_c0_g1_i1:244-858(-)
MESLKKKACGIASSAAPVAGAALIKAGAALEAAAPVAAKAADKAGAAADAAKGAAMQNATVADAVAKHGDKAAAAKSFVGGALAKAFTPSKELLAFAKNPTQEGLLANPDLIFHGIALLNNLRHPKAAAMSGLLQEGMERAAQSEAVEKAQQAAVHEGISRTVSRATDGVVEGVPPEVSKAALAYAKQNPQEVMQLFKLAATLR